VQIYVPRRVHDNSRPKEVEEGEQRVVETKTRKKVGIPKEIYPGECRWLHPQPKCYRSLALKSTESGAGAANRTMPTGRLDAKSLQKPRHWAEADIVLKVRPPDMQSNLGKHEELLCEGGTLISFIWPAQNPDLIGWQGVATVLAMDAVPRISRAQRWMP